jgi:zinc resistance-associated protein
MLKPLIAATAVLAIAGSSVVYAQQGFGGHRGFGNDGPRAEHRHRPSAEDVAAYTDARIAALKAGLELTSDQAKNWPAFEQALRDMATLRAQRMQARQAAAGQPQQTPTTPFDRMSRRAETMTKFSAALKKVADSGAPLYMSLNDAQKGRFAMLARKLRPHHRHGGGQNGGWRDGDRGHGKGQGHGGWQGRHFGQNGQGQGQDGRGQDGFHGRDGRHGMMNRSANESSNDL